MDAKLKAALDQVRATHKVNVVDRYSKVRVPTDCKIFYAAGGIGQGHFSGKTFPKLIKPFKNLVVYINKDNCSYVAY